MMSDRRHAANRANAMKSTGPRTVEGKRRVSKNARRHGLTTQLNHEVVASWIEAILDDPKLHNVELGHDALALASTLAEAEARLERVRRAEFRFLEDYHALDRAAAHLEKRFVTERARAVYRAAAPEFFHGEWIDGGYELASERRTVNVKTRQKSYASELRRLFRYHREAECARRRALKAWIGFLKELPIPEIEPMEEADTGEYSETNPFPFEPGGTDSKTKPKTPVKPKLVEKNVRYSGDFEDGMPEISTRRLPYTLLL